MTRAQLYERLKNEERSSDVLVISPGSQVAQVTSLSDLAKLDEEPPRKEPAPVRRSHDVEYSILGDDLQTVEVWLDPGETVIAEAGSMMYMESGIEYEARMGDGSQPEQGLLDKVLSGAKRKLTGESLFMAWFTNVFEGKRKVAFAAPTPGKILRVDLHKHGGELICQKSSFLCAAKGTRLGITLTKRIGAGIFGGEGFILQHLSGDGNAFLHAGGALISRDLEPGEKLRVDTGCIVAFTKSVDYDIEPVKGVVSALFGGEGLFWATLKGPGRVWLQSLPLSRLADRIYAAAPQAAGARKKEEGGLLGGIQDLVSGD
ncbi:MAG TPA: TIGR00266 family protein [Elusimicrobia bacterium]|nr:TIGR00266 family protein [Elusimicrobiota bacterium]